MSNRKKAALKKRNGIVSETNQLKSTQTRFYNLMLDGVFNKSDHAVDVEFRHEIFAMAIHCENEDARLRDPLVDALCHLDPVQTGHGYIQNWANKMLSRLRFYK
jgi:hypothetical protein